MKGQFVLSGGRFEYHVARGTVKLFGIGAQRDNLEPIQGEIRATDHWVVVTLPDGSERAFNREVVREISNDDSEV